MGELTFDQLGDRLAQGKRGGSFFLKTDDPFLQDEAIALLVRAHLEDGSTDFDLDQIDGSEADPANLSALLETPPMLSAHRVVVIRAAQGLSPKTRAVVEEAIRRPTPGRVLIVAAQIPRRSKAKFYDVLRKHSATVSLRAPRPSELAGWLAKRARQLHGAEIEMPAAQLLATGIGPQLGVLASELEKLVTYVEPRKQIGLDEVRRVVGALPQVDRWGWIDKVAERDLGAALAELPALLDSGESAVGLIGSLSEALIRVGLAGAGEAILARVLKRDGSYGNLKWKIRIYVQQAGRWSVEAIEAALADLLRADRLIKSGGLADRVALEEALLRMAAAAEAPAVATARSGGARGRTGG